MAQKKIVQLKDNEDKKNSPIYPCTVAEAVECKDGKPLSWWIDELDSREGSTGDGSDTPLVYTDQVRDEETGFFQSELNKAQALFNTQASNDIEDMKLTVGSFQGQVDALNNTVSELGSLGNELSTLQSLLNELKESSSSEDGDRLTQLILEIGEVKAALLNKVSTMDFNTMVGYYENQRDFIEGLSKEDIQAVSEWYSAAASDPDSLAALMASVTTATTSLSQLRSLIGSSDFTTIGNSITAALSSLNNAIANLGIDVIRRNIESLQHFNDNLTGRDIESLTEWFNHYEGEDLATIVEHVNDTLQRIKTIEDAGLSDEINALRESVLAKIGSLEDSNLAAAVEALKNRMDVLGDEDIIALENWFKSAENPGDLAQLLSDITTLQENVAGLEGTALTLSAKELIDFLQFSRKCNVTLFNNPTHPSWVCSTEDASEVLKPIRNNRYRLRLNMLSVLESDQGDYVVHHAYKYVVKVNDSIVDVLPTFFTQSGDGWLSREFGNYVEFTASEDFTVSVSLVQEGYGEVATVTPAWFKDVKVYDLVQAGVMYTKVGITQISTKTTIIRDLEGAVLDMPRKVILDKEGVAFVKLPSYMCSSSNSLVLRTSVGVMTNRGESDGMATFRSDNPLSYNALCNTDTITIYRLAIPFTPHVTQWEDFASTTSDDDIEVQP